jgi:hypothetical protein
MITRHTVVHEGGYNVIPHVRVAAGKATLLALDYEWAGVRGKIPELSVDLLADLGLEKAHVVGVYEKDGERKVVVDSRAIDMSQSAMARSGDSADAILGAQGWTRCFLLFQTFIPPGLTGVVEDENTTTQVFEHTSRPANV